MTSVSATALERIDRALEREADASDAVTERLAEDARKYLERRSLRERQKIMQEEAELEGLQSKPTINENSARLAANKRAQGDVAASLHADAETHRLNRERLAAAQIHEEAMLARPAITKQAALLVREGDISERLYQMAKSPTKGQTKKAKQPQLQFTRKEEVIRHTEVLHKKAMEMRDKRTDAARAEAKRLRENAHPKLNTRTRQIVAELGQSSAERLLRASAVNKRPPVETAADKELTFRPKINPVSEQIAKGVQNQQVGLNGAHERLYNEHSEQRARRSVLEEQFHKSKEERDLEGCTFKPSIIQYDARNCTDERCEESVVKRLEQWKLRRNQRLELQRDEREREEAQSSECTFSPQINVASNKKATGSDASAGRGVDAYVARQKKAREERERRRSALDAPPKWSNKITIPVAPRLGTSERAKKESVESAPLAPGADVVAAPVAPAVSQPFRRLSVPARAPPAPPVSPPFSSPQTTEANYEYASLAFRELSRTFENRSNVAAPTQQLGSAPLKSPAYDDAEAPRIRVSLRKGGSTSANNNAKVVGTFL